MGTELTLPVPWKVKVFVHAHLPIAFSHMKAERMLPVTWEVKCFNSLRTFCVIKKRIMYVFVFQKKIARIIIVSVYEDKAREILCAVGTTSYRLKFFM